ncbi:hypothetical protein [Marinobacter sp. X15-166B]|uniref:hypothetical protein n=1 Tax=Marinobacter sp. X15-166B TaxID=1897620 RepID=UPI00114C8CDD|nr:hypothetical protein [Marinobacter sp. X15-166B]
MHPGKPLIEPVCHTGHRKLLPPGFQNTVPDAIADGMLQRNGVSPDVNALAAIVIGVALRSIIVVALSRLVTAVALGGALILI